jgi:hypothetical protein
MCIRDRVGDPTHPGDVLARVRGGWAEDLARRAADDPDSDWAVYREGGVDALDALAPDGPS